MRKEAVVVNFVAMSQLLTGGSEEYYEKFVNLAGFRTEFWSRNLSSTGNYRLECHILLRPVLHRLLIILFMQLIHARWQSEKLCVMDLCINTYLLNSDYLFVGGNGGSSEKFVAVDSRSHRNTNVRVTRQDPLTSWLRDVISRHNCQTAVQATLLSRPAY